MESYRHMKEYPFHPVSELFPMMAGAAFDELLADIKENGLRESIWLHDEKIIDGRNRYEACRQAGIEATYRQYEGNGNGDLTKFVVSLNLHRRHLNESQRGMIGAKIATRKTGDKYGTPDAGVGIPTPAITVGQAAEMLNVSRDTVSDARKVRRDAIPEVVAEVEAGNLSLHAAEKIAAEPRENQPAVLAEHKKPRSERVAQSSGKKTFTKSLPNRKAGVSIRNAIGTLVGLATGLDSFKASDADPTQEETKQWERDLSEVVSAINRFRRQLQGQGQSNGEEN